MTQESSTEVEMGWMAAVIAPRDVSPHPNFWSSESITPFGILALLEEGRQTDYARLLSERKRDEAWSGMRAYEPLFDAVRASMSLGTVSSGADALARIARDGLASDTDLALRVACAVTAATALVEVNRALDARALLAQTLAEVERRSGWQMSFLALWLLNVQANAQQSLSAHALDNVAKSQQIVREEWSPSGVTFNISRGSSVSAQECLQDIWDVLSWAAAHHAARSQSDWNARLLLVRRPTPRLALRIRSRIGDSLEVALREDFRTTFSRPSERQIVFGEERNGDSELFEALTWHEHVGSPFVRHYRGLLGRARFLRGISCAESWLTAEGLRLLRQADLDKEVGAASLYLHQQGPLHLLRDEGERVLEAIDVNDAYSLSDLTLIRHAASLLDSHARTSALTRLFADRASHDGPRLKGGAGTEKTWQAIHALSDAEGTDSIALEVLLEEIAKNLEGEHADAHAYARLVGLWRIATWDNPKVRNRVAELSTNIKTSNSVELNRAIELAADRLAPPAIASEKEINLQTVARYVDRAMLHSDEIPGDVVPRIESLLRDQLAATQKDAHEGRFTGGGLKEAELAVALMFVTSSVDLWKELLNFVLDPAVQRDDKTAALTRMATRAGDLPEVVTEVLRERSSDLLDGGPEFMGSALRPYPAGVRLLAMIGGLGVGAPLSLVAELMAMGTPSSRHEAGVTLVALAHRGETSEWFESTCLWLTYEADAHVRSLAGQALAISDASWNRTGRHERLASLLQEEGTLVPLRVLAGVEEANRVPQTLHDIAVSLAASHMSTEVRQAARTIVSKPNSVGGLLESQHVEGGDAPRTARQVIRRATEAIRGWLR